jgi:hypothetical protein
MEYSYNCKRAHDTQRCKRIRNKNVESFRLQSENKKRKRQVRLNKNLDEIWMYRAAELKVNDDETRQKNIRKSKRTKRKTARTNAMDTRLLAKR